MAFEIKDPPEFTTDVEQWDRETLADGAEMSKPIGKLLGNTVYNKKETEKVKNPEFDDSGTVSSITDYLSFYNSIKTKMSIFDFFKNLKAGMKFMLNVGQLVSDGATNNPNLPASAQAVYKVMQEVSKLNADIYALRGAVTVGTDFQYQDIKEALIAHDTGIYFIDSSDGATGLPDGGQYQTGIAIKRHPNQITILLPKASIPAGLFLCAYNNGQWAEWREI